MFRVLHIMAGADAGGISSVVLNYYRHIDREKFHFDIAITTDMNGQNGRQLEELGARIFSIPLKSNGIQAYERSLAELIRREGFDGVHVHENETSYIALRAAKKLGVPCRVAHAHTSSPYTSWKSEIRRLSGCILNYHFATTVIGCGKLAGDRVFGKRNMHREKAVVLPNAIETEKFEFDPTVREAVRDELHINGCYVTGLVGRLSSQKNQEFLLRFFGSVHDKIPQARLVLAGNGPEEAALRQTVQRKNMSEYVLFLGRRGDVQRLYQAFDLFVMPSLYEGFPVAAVEAMASGLPVLLSDTITRELSFGSAVRYLPLEPLLWADAIRDEMRTCGGDRELRQAEVKQHGLDIRDTVKILEQVYTQRRTRT